MSFYPSATITAVDMPAKYWYTAITAYGRQANGVRLYGTGSQFYVGQKVDIFQCGEEFGFAEMPLSYKSQLVIPDKYKGTVAKVAPASLALAYLANLVDNKRYYYKPGIVVEIIDTWYMRVSSDLAQNPLTLLCVINTSGFYVGARVLIKCMPRPQVIGWWNCLPEEEPEDKPDWWTDEDEEWWDNGDFSNMGLHRNRVYAIMIGRIPFTADFDISIISSAPYHEIIKAAIFTHRDPASNICFVSVYTTTPEDDYFYVKASMGILYGAILERYWIRIHKTTFTFYEMSESEFPPNPGVPYSITENQLQWWWNGTTADVSDGFRTYLAFNPGPTSDTFLPLHKWHYNTNDFRS